ncbi:alpha/beta fold hydrolase [Lutibacter sp. A64]|uniref:alpha/beta hydrolase n=1 Tax=Lutibacter sp. A64 TaxID=2918526 RepID=UPI001F06C868|nr:alpha/beta hydrolase [Lutibacter sp. A64]UMB54420.1 alpha/beta fold hydrolase [Lutibacter sp. A64]
MKQNKPNTPTKAKNIPKIPRSVIIPGKILQSIAPSLATKYAIKLFTTPITYKTPEREQTMAKSAKKKMILIPELNKKIMVYTYGYSKRKVLLVHGWSGRGTQMYKIADKLLENGFMTISFDAPAHGESEGKSTMMTEFITASNYIEKKYGPFEYAIGHSLGGMTVLNNIKQGLTVKKAIIIGAGDIITDIFNVFVSKIELKQKIVPKMKGYFLKKFGEDVDNYSASLAAKEVKIPTLIIHDEEDREVPVSCAHNIRRNTEQGELLITKRLGHTRILKDDFVIDTILKFIKRNT